MMKNPIPVTIAVLFLAACFLVVAGCTSIPGPEARFTPLPTTTPIPVTPQVKVTTTPVVTSTTVIPVTTATTVVVQEVYETRSCAELGGITAGPGWVCPGTWLMAGDTFNCCSTEPVREVTTNVTVTVQPLDLVIVMDDDPGSILP